MKNCDSSLETLIITQCGVVLLTIRSSDDADKPARRIYWSVKSPNTIPYVRYSFPLVQ